MEVVFELLLELFGEVLINLVFSLLGLAGEHALQPYRRPVPRSAAASIASHVVFGAMLGGLSLLVFRRSMVTDDLARVATLFFAPVSAGGLSALIGVVLRKRGKDTVPLERFGYAYLFAFSASAVRFLATW